jgi:hypothetical protein
VTADVRPRRITRRSTKIERYMTTPRTIVSSRLTSGTSAARMSKPRISICRLLACNPRSAAFAASG